VIIPRHSTWAGATVYQSPNNATGVVDHFSKRVTLRKYTATQGWQCNGLAVAGEPELFDFWCVIKPTTSRSKTNRTVLDEGGEYSGGEWRLYYNPYHANHPEEGLQLQLSDDESDYSGFADVIEYQGNLWIVREHQKIDVDYGESEKLYIGKATIERWAAPVDTNTFSNESAGHYVIK
jgi:hypothetical protein